MSSIYLYFFHLFYYFITKQEKIYIFRMFRSLYETYLNHTCSIHSSVKSTSTRRKYGFGTEQVYPWYGTDKYFFIVLSYESENKPVNLHRLIKYITKYQP